MVSPGGRKAVLVVTSREERLLSPVLGRDEFHDHTLSFVSEIGSQAPNMPETYRTGVLCGRGRDDV